MMDRLKRNWVQASAWERLAWTVWVAAVFIVCVRSALQPEKRTVLPIYLGAGQCWLAGGKLYQLIETNQDIFRYSPLAAACFAPLSMLPASAAAVCWRLLSAGALVTALLWWFQGVAPRRQGRTCIALFMLLIWPMALPSLNNGQVNLVLLSLVLAAVAATASERFNLAAVCLAAACWLKIYPIALGLLLTIVYPRRLGPRFALALLAFFLLPFILQSPNYVLEQYREWVWQLRMDDREKFALDYWLRDIRLLFRVYWQPISAQTFLVLQLSAAAICASCCLAARWLWRLEMRQILYILTSLACCWMTLFGPSTESSTWILLGPSLASALLIDRMQQAPLWRQGLLRTSYLLFLITLMTNWFRWGKAFSNLGTQAVAGLLFFAWTLFFGLSLLKRAEEVTDTPANIRAAA